MSIIDRIVQLHPFLLNIDEYLKKSKPVHLCWLFEKLGLPVPRYFFGWTDTGGGDHGGADWEPADDTAVAGNHTNIGAFNVLTGRTVKVEPWNGASYGSFEVHALTISVVGTITGSGKGYGGGGAGGGGGGSGWTAGGAGAAGGAGVAGGSAGSAGANGGVGSGSYSGAGGVGGAGGGSYGGTGGAGGAAVTGAGSVGNVGAVGVKGGYATAQGQGDTTTDETLLKGSAGGGAGGASGGGSDDWGGGGGGGGAANRGAGWIKLYATTSISITGIIYAKGLDNSAGNGTNGANGDGIDTGGAGGAGGAASASGLSNGGSGGSGYAGSNGGAGGEGGYGAGGGILLKCLEFDAISLSGALFDNRGGVSATGNGGTIKIFYSGDPGSPPTGGATLYYGRLYTYAVNKRVILEESLALLESLTLIDRQFPPLEEAIALKDVSHVPAGPDMVLEESLALAESFEASEQTIVRVDPSTEFLAEQAKRSNTPAKRIWLYINSDLYDITDKFMSMGPIDRKMTYKPGETKGLTISDQDLVMSNADKYFSDLNEDSPFHDRDYAGADQIKVYAGFIIPSTGYAEVLQKADMKLISIELMTKEAHAHLRCHDSFREVFDIYVGMPDSDGTPNPLTYTSKTFKYIMDDLLINKAGIPSGNVDIEVVSLTFSSISFEKKRVRECVQKLSEVARGNTVILGNGKVEFRRFVSEATDVDLILRSEEGKEYSRLRYTGQDFLLKVNKVVVIGATGVYAEAEISGETGVTLKYENDAILTDAVATDVATECLGRFAVHPAKVEVSGEYLPSLDLKSIVKVYEPNSMMNPAIFQVRELALDIVGFRTPMLLSIPDSAGRGKTWTTKADWEGGTLDKIFCPSGEESLELEYGELSGTGEWIYDAGSGKTANWVFFNHSKQNTKRIWWDDFRANSISKYTLHNMPGWNDGAGVAPGYDGVNKRLIINTGDNNGTTLEIPGLSVQNVKASIDVYITGQYPTNAAGVQFLRWINGDNEYVMGHQAVGASVSSGLQKWVNNVFSELTTPSGHFPKSTRRWLKFEINGSSLKGYTDDYTHSATDTSFPNAGKVLMGCWQSIGYVYELLVEHYTLPSPVQCTITFRFATSDNNVDWSAWETDIANCADSRYIKVEATLARTDLGNSAMPVLEDMTVGYFLKGS